MQNTYTSVTEQSTHVTAELWWNRCDCTVSMHDAIAFTIASAIVM